MSLLRSGILPPGDEVNLKLQAQCDMQGLTLLSWLM